MSSGRNAGSKAGEALKGAWDTFSGAGESIRGNINAAVDSAGSTIANDGKTTTSSSDSSLPDKSATHAAGVARDEQTASKGEAQIRAGIDKLVR